MDPTAAVVGDQGGGLGVVGLQSRLQSRLVVVRAADQRLSSHLGEARGQLQLAAAWQAPPSLLLPSSSTARSCRADLQGRAEGAQGS